MISEPDVLVIDTRNEEEVALGTFANAVDPGTTSFTEFADFVATLDPAAQGMPIVQKTESADLQRVMSNSFGFGGTNASLIMKAI